jgi:hypothetical protein
MQSPIEVIVRHGRLPWKHIPTGEWHYVVHASPFEVTTISLTHSWLGKAVAFIREFEAVDEDIALV